MGVAGEGGGTRAHHQVAVPESGGRETRRGTPSSNVVSVAEHVVMQILSLIGSEVFREPWLVGVAGTSVGLTGLGSVPGLASTARSSALSTAVLSAVRADDRDRRGAVRRVHAALLAVLLLLSPFAFASSSNILADCTGSTHSSNISLNKGLDSKPRLLNR